MLACLRYTDYAPVVFHAFSTGIDRSTPNASTEYTPMSDSDINYSIEHGVATLTFNRPQARNALTFEMYDQLAEISQSLIDNHEQLHALVVTGAGDKAFAAGTDISRFRDFNGPEDALNYERQMDRVLGTFESIPIPTIAAIRGACTGGGAAIAACCDIRIASDDLKYGFPIARTLGNCLSLSNLSRLVYLIGAARTREIIFTARLILSEEACSIGLISEIHNDPLQRAYELAQTMKGHAPLTMAATKEGLRRLREKAAAIENDDLIVQCYTSNDFKEGLEAFLEKRKPQWSGK